MPLALGRLIKSQKKNELFGHSGLWASLNSLATKTQKDYPHRNILSHRHGDIDKYKQANSLNH